MGSKYEYFEGGKKVGEGDTGRRPLKAPETIKERIDRETRTQMEAGRIVPPIPAGNSLVDPEDPDKKWVETEDFYKLGLKDWGELFRAFEVLMKRPISENLRTNWHYLRYGPAQDLHKFGKQKIHMALFGYPIGHNLEDAAPEPERYESRVRFNSAGEPFGVEVLRDGEPWYLLSMDSNREPFTGIYQINQVDPVGVIVHHKDGGSEKIMFNEMSEFIKAFGPQDPKPGPWTQQAIVDVTGTLGARGHSYTVHNEFQNFEEQAAEAEQTMRQVFNGALAQKKARERATNRRLEELLSETGGEGMDQDDLKEYHELFLQWLDSIRDICGYSLLFFGWAKQLLDKEAGRLG